MARDLHADHKNAVIADTVYPIFMIEGEFDSGTVRFWSGLGDLVYDSNTYTGAGHLLNFSEITETQKIEGRGITVELSGIPSSIISIVLTEEYQGRPVNILFAVLDSDGAMLGDPFTYFSGKADTMIIEETGETVKVQMTAESDLVALFRASERRRTPEDQKMTYSGDTLFDKVASLQSADFVWGKGS